MELFEKATRKQLRFNTPVGQLSTEDMWALPLTSSKSRPNLDDVARDLHKQLKNGDDVSFVHEDRKSDETTQLKFDIVKHIIDVKLEEKKRADEARANAERKQKILSIIADREDEQLKSMSMDELKTAVLALS